jgi:iron complex outermembrane recepter protein
MQSTTRLSCAIAAALAGVAVGGARAAATSTAAPSAGSDTSDEIAEITVTAQRRTQSAQDVPITMQALTSETLQQLDIKTLDDYIRYLPNVTSSTNGPGQGNIYMRGLSAGAGGSQAAGSLAQYPNVAIYLDDQSGQLPARNLDIYAADLDRIEVLEGPQGTLFGAGAEAGVVRYITNKPKLDVTEGNVEAGYGTTAHGDPNAHVTAVLNLPLVDNTLAVRGVIYDDNRGGYINNVPGTFTRRNTDLGIHYANYPAVNGQCPNGLPNSGYCVPPGSPVLNNDSITGSAINPVTYSGIRAEALYRINDDWNFLLSQMYQNMNSQGVFYQMPQSSDGVPLQPLEVTLFNNSYDKDKFENTAWTLTGKLGPLNAIYTGGYLDRNVTQVGDYTNYSRGVYADYYQCFGPGTGGDTKLKSTCYSPSSVWLETERNEHLTEELRLSTPDDWRARGIIGAFYEDNILLDQTHWAYKNIPDCTSDGAAGTPGNSGCLSNIGTPPGVTVSSPGVQGDNISFIEDTRRETKQIAFFMSGDYDLIPKVLTLTAGTRYYHFENSLVGDITSGFGCFEQGVPPGGCIASANNIDARHLADTETGFKSRANVTWHVTSDQMIYYTWSQGFRPGGFNRTGGAQFIPGPDGMAQFVLPNAYKSDELTNNELGWKTEFLGRRLQWDGAVYQENWNNAQVNFFDPGETGNLVFGTNGQNFRIRGIETSLIAKVTAQLTLQGVASRNHSVQTNSPALIDANPASVNYGKPITESCGGGTCTPISNLFGPVGSPTANSPPIQFSLRARYDWTVDSYNAYAQLGASHTGQSFTQAGANPSISANGAINSNSLRFEDPAYTTYDASCGVAKNAWHVRAYAQNLSNSHASVFTNSAQFVVAETPLRPRVIGVDFGYNF